MNIICFLWRFGIVLVTPFLIYIFVKIAMEVLGAWKDEATTKD